MTRHNFKIFESVRFEQVYTVTLKIEFVQCFRDMLKVMLWLHGFFFFKEENETNTEVFLHKCHIPSDCLPFGSTKRSDLPAAGGCAGIPD